MKIARISVLLVLFSWTAVSCDRHSEEAVPAEPTAPEKAAVQVEPESPGPILTDAEIQELIFGESPDGDVPDLKSLPTAQQATLRAAMEKAVQSLDVELLASSVSGSIQFGGNGIKNAELQQGVTQIRTLTPDEAKKLGIDIEKLGLPGGRSGVVVHSDIQIIQNGEDGQPVDLPEGNSSVGISVERVMPIEVEQESDPERALRIQEFLEAGDSDGLANELGPLIQGALDAAAYQQLLGQ